MREGRRRESQTRESQTRESRTRVLEDVSRIKESDERVVEANERAGGESRYESLKRESMTRELGKRFVFSLNSVIFVG